MADQFQLPRTQGDTSLVLWLSTLINAQEKGQLGHYRPLLPPHTHEKIEGTVKYRAFFVHTVWPDILGELMKLLHWEMQ